MEFTITADHPAIPGHFPGRPIVPGVVILDEIAARLASWRPGARISRVVTAKFTSPLTPGETCRLSFSPRNDGRLGFTCQTADRIIATGTLEIDPPLA